MSTDEIQKAITEKANELYANACKKHGVETRKLFIFFDLKGTSAGVATILGVINFNLFMAENNFEEFMIDTVPHEVAHAVVYTLELESGKHYKPHGIQWKCIVEEMGYVPSRTHHFEPEKKGRRFIYECINCGCVSKVSTRMHNKIQARGQNLYRCARCHSHIRFVGEE